MQTVWYILAVLGTIAGQLAGLTGGVLILASGANASESQIVVIKRLGWSVALLCVAALIGAIVAMVKGRPALATGIGVSPAVILTILFAVLIAKGV